MRLKTRANICVLNDWKNRGPLLLPSCFPMLVEWVPVVSVRLYSCVATFNIFL